MVAEIKSNNIGVNHTKSTMTAAAPEHRISSITTQVVGVSHAYVCPKRKQVWLEGIRVNPKYRRTGIASQLLDQMIKYGKGIDSNIDSCSNKCNIKEYVGEE
ncbi:MAG: GNAT family N-acetyltransferase [Nitrososphaeraceae archaeon]